MSPVKRITMILVLLIGIFVTVGFGINHIIKPIKAQTEYTTHKISVTRYARGPNMMPFDSYTVLTSDNKQLAIIDDGTNKINIRESLKYTNQHVTLDQYVAKNANYLKQIHADLLIPTEYYVLTIYKPLKGQVNN